MNKQDPLLLGVVADDLTGATDIALALVQAGFSTTVLTEDLEEVAHDTDAVVVALMTRSVPAAEAVERSLAAFKYLREAGAQRFYFKYCSTFDSTPEGNIGPVLDAAMEFLRAEVTVVVPSFPATGRTVYQGHLFVGDRLLSDSPMRDHPLNPMRDSFLPRVLQEQSSLPVGMVPWQTVRQGAPALQTAIEKQVKAGSALLVVDALDGEDLGAIAAATAELPFLSGGSALAGALRGPRAGSVSAWQAPDGPHVVLAGSASQATRLQVAAGLKAGDGRQLDAAALRDDFHGAVADLVDEVFTSTATPFVIYATATPEDVQVENAALFQAAFAEIAQALVARGAPALVVAGGETSGAVTAALQVRSLQIGKIIDDGVAWATASLPEGRTIELALKSGNFGSVDMFAEVWEE